MYSKPIRKPQSLHSGSRPENPGWQVEGHRPACLSVHPENPMRTQVPSPPVPLHSAPRELWTCGRCIYPRQRGFAENRVRPRVQYDWDTPFRDHRNPLNPLPPPPPPGPEVAHHPSGARGFCHQSLPSSRAPTLLFSFQHSTILEKCFAEAFWVRLCLGW